MKKLPTKRMMRVRFTHLIMRPVTGSTRPHLGEVDSITGAVRWFSNNAPLARKGRS